MLKNKTINRMFFYNIELKICYSELKVHKFNINVSIYIFGNLNFK